MQETEVSELAFISPESSDVARREVAAELHDRVMQPLAALVTSIECLQGPQLDSMALASGLRTCLSLAREAAVSLRLTLSGLKAHPHAAHGLPAAIRLHLQPQLRELGLPVRLEVLRWPQDVPLEISSSLYLAVREAVTNVWKHAGAHEAHVRLDASASCLRVRVWDDGSGFPVGALSGGQPRGDGWGLRSMRQRLDALGGQLVVSSSPDAGTLIEMLVPWGREELTVECLPAAAEVGLARPLTH
jgi:signal transduction histidine kinase